MRPELVIFDCDGVIVDSETPMLRMLYAELTALGADIGYDAFHAEGLGGTVPDIADRFRDRGLPLPDGWADAFYERLYERLADGTPLIDGVGPLFGSLRAAGIAVAVGSNGRGRKMTITLGQHPDIWARVKDHVFSGQDLNMTKPAPDLYLYIAAQMGVPPVRTVVIEDSPTGATAAARAGMRCLGFAPDGNDAALAAAGAEVFACMAEVPALLGLRA